MDYRIDEEHELVLCKPKDDFEFEDLLEHLNKLISDPLFQPGMRGLYDFTRVRRVNGNLEHFLEAAKIASDRTKIDDVSPVAIVLSKDNQVMRGVFDGYVLMASNSLVDYKIFNCDEYEKALEYLGIDFMPEF